MTSPPNKQKNHRKNDTQNRRDITKTPNPKSVKPLTDHLSKQQKTLLPTTVHVIDKIHSEKTSLDPSLKKIENFSESKL